MYFSLEVKETKKDLFNFERELETLVREIRDPLTRMIVIKGVRRTGKSSLLRVGVAESGLPFIRMDVREIEPLTTSEVYELFASSLSRSIEKFKAVKSILRRISGITVAETKVDFASRKKSTLLEILDKLHKLGKEKKRFVVLAIDEAQRLKAALPGFEGLLAHLYDYCGGLKLVLTGSEVGVLNGLLGKEDAKAPLFGRPYYLVELQRFDIERATGFLKAGFGQQRLRVSDDEIEEAVTKFDGVVGWLTSYGYYRLKHGHKRAIDLTIQEGTKLVQNELASFLAPRIRAKQRYLTILESLVYPQTWSGVKRRIEAKFGRISNKQLSHYLAELVGYGFATKAGNQYALADPLIERALSQR